MNKIQRLEEIVRLVNQKGTVRVSELMEIFNVTDMTIRRDLAELEEQDILTRIHGGARSNHIYQYQEISHVEKHTQNIAEKRYIAQLAEDLIEEGDTIFLGPGTTVQFLAERIQNQHLTVITNCLPVFKILLRKKTEYFKVFLLGGEMRQVTESFVGELTNSTLETMHFSKMFFSGNGILENKVLTSTLSEAYTQRIALNNSIEKYLLVDSSKIDKGDFVTLCHLNDLTAVIIDNNDTEKLQGLSDYTDLIYK